VSRASASFKHLLLALFLCLGMIALSGPGIGPTCTERAAKSCGCCPMDPGETCCSQSDAPVPEPAPVLPESRGKQQAFQAVPFSQPILTVLPPIVPVSIPRISASRLTSGQGPSPQALLCVRTV
jgi:hypothetical protein